MDPKFGLLCFFSSPSSSSSLPSYGFLVQKIIGVRKDRCPAASELEVGLWGSSQPELRHCQELTSSIATLFPELSGDLGHESGRRAWHNTEV
ncbi:hypothetical protein CRG98_025145 [Punica granatum]|uniref:Uncharacterized protein n=1 Tax=Punica granatum TaxID=22663 RepID=A0A2I0JDY1_PUNGR|nr:hypothetical protein CRG98_025145 [Punica granatum]